MVAMASVEPESPTNGLGQSLAGRPRLNRAASGPAPAAPASRAFSDRRRTERERNSGPVLGRPAQAASAGMTRL